MTVKELKRIEADLKAGGEFVLSSDDHELQIHYVKGWDGSYRFLLWFNGTILESARTLRPVITKVEGLTLKYGLR